MKKFLIFLSFFIIGAYILYAHFPLLSLKTSEPSLHEKALNWQKLNIISPTLAPTQGETFMAQDLASYFKSKGKKVRLFDTNSYITSPDFDAFGRSVNIFIHAWHFFTPPVHGINIAYLWLPDMGKLDYHSFDLIATASSKQALMLKEKGLPAVYIPQFSNAERFTYDYNPNLNVPVLFVGNLYDTDKLRPSVEYALQKGIDIDVYGRNWEKYIPLKYVKGTFIENDELHKYYASAQIVLNDHQPNMRANGFISNRVFDVTASKGFLISDYMPEIQEAYGDSIPMYHNADDFAELIFYYLNHPREREQKAQKAHQITMRRFTLQKVGDRLMQEITKVIEKRIKEKTITLD